MASKNQVTLTFAGDEKKLVASTTKAGDATEKMANQVAKSSEHMEKATKDTTEKSGKSFGGFVGKLGEVGLALQGLETVGNVVSNAIGGADIGGKLSAQLGKSSEDAGKLGALSGKIYAENFGDSIDDVGTSVSNVVRNIGDVGKLGEAGLKQVSEQALTLKSVFDVDVTDSTNAVGHLLRNNLVKDAQSGMDLVTAAFQRIPAAADDGIETLNEYSVQFVKLGLDGPKSLGLIAQGMQAGARDTDTIADALKEFSIRAIDGSKASEDGFKSLGLNAKITAADIAKGGDSAAKGLDTVLDRLRGMHDPVERNRIAVELFGTKAEDLGKALFALDPSTAVAGLGDVAGAADRAGEAMSQGPTAKIEAAKRAFTGWATDVIGGVVIPAITVFVDFLNATLVPVLSAIVGWLKENWDWLSVVLTVIAAMAAPIIAASAAIAAWRTITELVTVAQVALNAVLNLNPILLIISLIAGLVTAFVILWNKSAAFRQFFIDVWDGIKNAVGAVVDWIKGAWHSMVQAFEDTVGWFGRVGQAIGNAISSGIKGAINWVIGVINGFVHGINWVIDGLNHVPGVNIGHIPDIPRLHGGGTVGGSPGSEQLRILQAGETVFPVDSPVSRGVGDGGTHVSFGGNVDSAFATAFMNLVRAGEIQITAA